MIKTGPTFSNIDPIAGDKWTLQMAAAWFIWRSDEAVRDQFEVSTRTWIPAPNRRQRGALRRSGPGVLSPSELRPGTLENVFAQAGFNIRLPSREPMPASIDAYRLGGPTLDAYGSLKFALQSGILLATRVWRMQNGEESEREPLSPNEWQSNFDLLASPPVLKPQTKPTARTSNAKASESTANDRGKKSKAPRPKSGNSAEAYRSEMEADLPDLSLKEADLPEIKESVDLASASIRGAAERSQRYEKVREPEFEIRVDREHAKRARREISTMEFRRTQWNIEQAVGWMAYEDESIFCSLFEGDLLGRRYYDHEYDLKFKTDRPDNDLLRFLRSGEIKAYQGREEMKKEEFEDIPSIWKAPSIQFDRNDVIRLSGMDNSNIKQNRIVTGNLGKKIGRPAKYEWAMAAGHMVRYIVDNDPKQAQIIEELKNWFETKGKIPDHSDIEKFVTEAMKVYKKS